MERRGEEAAMLIAQSGLLNGQRWSINKTLLIGRDTSCDIIIADRQVSRHHARLQKSSNGILLEDLGSKNGTTCNGSQITDTVLLQDGDVIQIALAQRFIYISSDATLPLESPLYVDQFSQPSEIQPPSSPQSFPKDYVSISGQDVYLLMSEKVRIGLKEKLYRLYQYPNFISWKCYMKMRDVWFHAMI